MTHNPPSPRPLRAAAFGGEVDKGLRALASDWRALVIQMATFPMFYLLIVLFVGRGELKPELLLPIGIGTVALSFIHEQVNRMFWSFQGDIQSGVLEQNYLTAVPSWVLILGRQVAAVLAAVPIALAVAATAWLAVTLTGGSVHADASALVPVAAIAAGTCGLALVLCGLALVYKRVQIVTQLSVAVFAITGGALVPLTELPDWAAALSRTVVPIAPGVEALRDILLHGGSLTDLDTGWGLGWLLLQPLLIVAAGIVLFTRLERAAKRRGTLSRY